MESGTLLIRPERRLFGRGLRELWSHRELVYFLIWRDVKVRYRQTVLGATWAVLQPFVLMVVFSVFFGHLGHLPSNGLPYPIFAYTALVPWTMFSSALTGASESLVGNASLVSKVYFPRLSMPLAAVLACVLDFVIAFVILLGMMVYYGVALNGAALLVPLFLLLAVVAALGAGTWLAALNVRYRDFRYTVPFLLQLWLFVTPVAYASSLVPHAWRWVYSLNPMTGVVQGFRWALLDVQPGPVPAVAISTAVAVAVLAAGLVYFQHVERTFADVI